MSIEEKRDEIIKEYHCQDVHGELCDDCEECRECLKEDLLKLETLVRTKVINEFVNAINSRLLRFVPMDYDDILFIAEQLKVQKNDGLNFHDEKVSKMNKTHLLLSAEQIAEIRAEERKKVIDEIYPLALNETHDTLIEWLQTNLID